MRLGIAADHEGYELKKKLIPALEKLGFTLIDHGAFALNHDDDFPDFVIPLAKSVVSKEVDRGIAICGSGIGACITANKIKNVRASVIQDYFSARQGVQDDDMNVICLGSKLTNFEQSLELIQFFLEATYNNESRFERRLKKISQLEEGMEIQ